MLPPKKMYLCKIKQENRKYFPICNRPCVSGMMTAGHPLSSTDFRCGRLHFPKQDDHSHVSHTLFLRVTVGMDPDSPMLAQVCVGCDSHQ